MSNIIRCASHLQALRKIRGYTQKELSILTGVNVRMIQGYEQGTKDINKASIETIYKLSTVLEVEIEELLIFNEEIHDFLERYEKIRYIDLQKKK